MREREDLGTRWAGQKAVKPDEFLTKSQVVGLSGEVLRTEANLDVIAGSTAVQYLSETMLASVINEWIQTPIMFNIAPNVVYELRCHLVFGATPSRLGAIRFNGLATHYTYRPIVTGNVSFGNDNVLILPKTVEVKPEVMDNNTLYEFTQGGYASTVIDMRGILIASGHIPLKLEFCSRDNLNVFLREYSYAVLTAHT